LNKDIIMRRAQIIGTGLYAPEKVISNQYFNDLYGEDVDSFLRKNRNIHERRYMIEGQVTSDLAAEAGRKALEQAGIQATDLDLVIVATDTPDYLSPSTAAVTQYKLGATHAGTFDINSACAGFTTALDIGSKYIASDSASDPQYRYVLVIGAYGMSRYIDFSVRNVATLFADGAGAVVLQATEDEMGVLTSKLATDGQYHDYMGLYVGGTSAVPTVECIQKGEHLLQFRKKFPADFNMRLWTDVIQSMADRLKVTLDEVDHFFFTQINILTIREVLDALQIPESKTHYIMDRYGYTGSAALPMVMADAQAQNKLKKGDLVFLITSGGGASMAAMALRWAMDQ
jgi:3-oxoacyl-[acyl-carrier-protein] synthase-3